LLCGLLLFVACVCSFAQEKEPVLEIPFDFYRNEIILQVKVNGNGPFNMMLDTGTDPAAVDLTTAKELGLKLQSLGARASGGGTEARVIYGTRLPVLDVGPLTVKNIETVALDLSKMGERLGKPLHGVLGHSFLNGRIVQIDYANRMLRLYARSPFVKALTGTNTERRIQPCACDHGSWFQRPVGEPARQSQQHYRRWNISRSTGSSVLRQRRGTGSKAVGHQHRQRISERFRRDDRLSE